MVSFLETLSQLPVVVSLFNVIPFEVENQIPKQKALPSIRIQQQQQQQHCPYPPTQSCPFPPPARDIDTCCVNHPSGHFLQTQFWDTSPALGPADSWTIHGLWPDLCNGGFEQFCDSTRRHDDIAAVLRSAAPPDLSGPLLEFMYQYWLALDGDHVHLWAHEWNKHGTCISTLAPTCYIGDGDHDGDNINDGGADNNDDDARRGHGHGHDDYNNYGSSNTDVLDYVVQTTSLFKTLDTYTILAEAGILPSHTATYTLRELQDAIESSTAHRAPVTFRCNRFAELNEIWYHFAVMGSLKTNIIRRNSSDNDDLLHGSISSISHSHSHSHSPFLNDSAIHEIFVPTNPATGARSNCPARGIKYRPKKTGPSPPEDPTGSISKGTTTAAATSTSTSTSTSSPQQPPFSGKGYLKVRVLHDPSTSRRRPSSSSSSSSLPASVLASENSEQQQQHSRHHRSDHDSASDDSNSGGGGSSNNNNQKGCLIRLGDWYTSGTCATFKAQPDVNLIDAADAAAADDDPDAARYEKAEQLLFSLSSSYSPCVVDPTTQKFECTKSTAIQTIFSSDPNRSSAILSYHNSSIFYAAHAPRRYEKVAIYADQGRNGERQVELEIQWVPV